MTSQQIRRQFLDFFASKAHEIVPSSPVVPLDDPTLMFTNAGMNQFKDVFLATGSRAYRRAADTQKCIRAGGKHNDLDDVGQDTYHHTFFEMLGNWSFGDYFKKEAIAWAWELLTEVWGIEKDRLHATYFEGDTDDGLEPDLEAAELWKSVTDIVPAHVHPGNKKDNFWEMGDTGPCGPCSEIHIDLTPDKSGAALVNAGDPRVIELWNLVFIQFNRAGDGKLTPLPAKHVDTGMGFERLCAVLVGMETGRLGQVSNYDTDVFTPLFDAIRERTGAPRYTGTLPGTPAPEPQASACADLPDSTDQQPPTSPAPDSKRQHVMVDVSYRVIADHVRCLAFALTDGAVPSNEGRGYVLRRILRRAVRYGRQYMNMHEPFVCDLIDPLVACMADTFPELREAHGGKNVEHVTELLRDEEESFGRTLDRGIKLFDEAAEYALRHHHGKISGEDAFRLHDTYGFPIDLTELMAEERDLTIDVGEYERLMEAARDRARTGALVSTDEFFDSIGPLDHEKIGECDDRFKYADPPECEATVTYVVTDPSSSKVALATDRTCFYVEQGGQVSDQGVIRTETGEVRVTHLRREGPTILHCGTIVSGKIDYRQKCQMSVFLSERRPTMQNHTSTHIMNWALREVLGEHVQQKGSLVDPEKTRFDFSHNKPLNDDEVGRVEDLCNRQIEAAMPVYTTEVDQKKAREINTLRAVFGEKYPDVVRVVSIGAEIDAMLTDPKNPAWMKYSVEFCGGTHLNTSAEAERFVLTTEDSVAKGVRRVVGVSGDMAREAQQLGVELLSETKTLADKTADVSGNQPELSGEALSVRMADLQRRLNDAVIPVRVRHEIQELLTELQKDAKKLAKAAEADAGDAVRSAVADLLTNALIVNGVTVVVGEVPSARPDALRGAIDWVRSKRQSSAVLLAAAADGKVTLIAGMSNDVVTRGIKAGDLIKETAPLVGGRGGGRPDMAQGGGSDPAGIPAAIERASTWISEKLS